jgi:hypothetical protein
MPKIHIITQLTKLSYLTGHWYGFSGTGIIWFGLSLVWFLGVLHMLYVHRSMHAVWFEERLVV